MVLVSTSEEVGRGDTLLTHFLSSDSWRGGNHGNLLPIRYSWPLHFSAQQLSLMSGAFNTHTPPHLSPHTHSPHHTPHTHMSVAIGGLNDGDSEQIKFKKNSR